MSTDTYIEGIGRRKTATARVRLFTGHGATTINDKPFDEYFKTPALQNDIDSVFTLLGIEKRPKVTVLVKGGGIAGQAEAVRHGLARAFLKEDETRRIVLKRAGFLMRDPRMKERKKFGLHKARRAPQWSKR